MKHLQCETLDIHAGGRDLIFPHHENEIAQSQALTHKPFARYWIHHGLLTINAQKMAKSLGNFITIEDALNRHSADDLKIFFLFSHYASSIDFTEEKIAEAHRALQKFDVLFWKTYEILKDKSVHLSIQTDFIQKQKNRFIEAMDDDFNTPEALASLFDLINATNKFIEEEKQDKNYFGIIYCAVDTIESFAKHVLGLFLKEKAVELTGAEEHLLEERQLARSQKNFKRSDELRELLRQKGITVEDGREGQTWRRV